jgi:hypothetical protein
MVCLELDHIENTYLKSLEIPQSKESQQSQVSYQSQQVNNRIETIENQFTIPFR